MGQSFQQESLVNRNFEIIQTGTFSLTRSAGSSSAQQTITAPVGATAFLAYGTLSGSPALTFNLTYYAPNGTGGILWGIRAYYDATAGAVKFFNESYDASVTSSTYIVQIRYYILKERSK